MPSRRLDFKALRANADFARVLAAYDIVPAKDGSRPNQLKALCPFHEDTNPSLKVNTERNIYHCFACGAKGNVLDFVMAMDGTDIRAAATRLADISGQHPELTASDTSRPAAKRTKAATAPAPPTTSETPEPDAAAPEVTINPPLSFTLKLTMDAELADWLAEHGIDDAATETFGLGRVSKRSKTIGGRLGIPLHDQAGQLIGYCGRCIDPNRPDDQPKYILPKGFRKELEVFNLHRYQAEPPALPVAILCESFLSVMRHQGHVRMLSTFGRSISTEQIALLKASGIERVLIAFDGDEPGRTGARAVAAATAPVFWTRVVDLPDGVKPHQLPWEELRPLLVDAWGSKRSSPPSG